jgi:hypothetical protein
MVTGSTMRLDLKLPLFLLLLIVVFSRLDPFVIAGGQVVVLLFLALFLWITEQEMQR